MTDYYALLGVPRNASDAQIKRAYRKIMKDGAHPDLGGDPERAKDITAGYSTLLDPSARAKYDEKLKLHESRSRSLRVRPGSGRSGGFGFGVFTGRSRRPRPEPRRGTFRLVACPTCKKPNRIPGQRSIVRARCGSCRAPLAGKATNLARALELLREGLKLKAQRDFKRALGTFHLCLTESPALKNAYLEIAAIYLEWGLNRQARLYHDLAEAKGDIVLTPEEVLGKR